MCKREGSGIGDGVGEKRVWSEREEGMEWEKRVDVVGEARGTRTGRGVKFSPYIISTRGER